MKFDPKWVVGILALGMLNAIAVIYDSEWLYVAVGLDIATVGAYLGVGLSGNGKSKSA